MPKRIVRLANRNPFLTSIVMSLLLLIVGLVVLQRQNDANVHRAKEQAVAEAKARADAVAKQAEQARADLAASQLDVCERAVTAVTNRLNADLLEITSGFEKEGRPTPAWALQLELLITNRQPPIAACVPKESP